MRAFYKNSVKGFLQDSVSKIKDQLTTGLTTGFHQQKSSQHLSWEQKISLLKFTFRDFPLASDWGLVLEYSIPRRAKRIDFVIIANNILFIVEYKNVEQEKYSPADVAQVEDYALDIRDFHFESKDRVIVPILLYQDGPAVDNILVNYDGPVQSTLFANSKTLKAVLSKSADFWKNTSPPIILEQWVESQYVPTPTIIEAAQALYAGKNVREITHSHAGSENLTLTKDAALAAIRNAQERNSKIICFITGVPGAGKTLAGLDIIHDQAFSNDKKEIGAFLSGNSPLVKVLREALSKDFNEREEASLKEANRQVSTFIQNVHQFIDDNFFNKKRIPTDKVLVYDEAQRAWTKEYKYRKSKSTGKAIRASEPEILLSIMDRHTDSWAVIICLVGSGQEINTGEGGLREWGKALQKKFKHWEICVSPQLLYGDHPTGNSTLFEKVPKHLTIIPDERFHLNVSLRAFKAKELSRWVNAVLLNMPHEARKILIEHLNDYPIYVTRSLEKAKQYLKENVRGSRRSGVIASSGAKRLRAIGIDMNGGLKGTSDQKELGAWYLKDSKDIRSSNFLEVAASEFAVQGLELDWTCVCWDADLCRANNDWAFRSFEGTKWKFVKQEIEQTYLLNKYRVLLTRAREGMVIFVPVGNNEDETRPAKVYDSIFNYVVSCGIKELP